MPKGWRNSEPSPRPMARGPMVTRMARLIRLQAADGDNDAINMALQYDASTPAGVLFDPTTGYFEWTPGAEVVDNASADSRADDACASPTISKGACPVRAVCARQRASAAVACARSPPSRYRL